jgi:hypothetical protein
MEIGHSLKGGVVCGSNAQRVRRDGLVDPSFDLGIFAGTLHYGDTHRAVECPTGKEVADRPGCHPVVP